MSNYYAKSRPFSAPGNAVGAQALDQARTVGNQLNATFNATFQFTDYLKLDVVSNVTWGLTQYTYYGNMNNPLNSNVKGKLAKDNTNTIRTNNTQTLTFYKQMGDHYLNVLAGHEYYRSDQQYLYGYAEGGFSPTILEPLPLLPTVRSTPPPTRAATTWRDGLVACSIITLRSIMHRHHIAAMPPHVSRKHIVGVTSGAVGAAWVINKESLHGLHQEPGFDYLKPQILYRTAG